MHPSLPEGLPCPPAAQNLAAVRVSRRRWLGRARPITSIAWVEEAALATFITVRTFVFLAQSQDARSCSLRCDEMYLPQRQSRKLSLVAMNHVEIPRSEKEAVYGVRC